VRSPRHLRGCFTDAPTCYHRALLATPIYLSAWCFQRRRPLLPLGMTLFGCLPTPPLDVASPGVTHLSLFYRRCLVTLYRRALLAGRDEVPEREQADEGGLPLQVLGRRLVGPPDDLPMPSVMRGVVSGESTTLP